MKQLLVYASNLYFYQSLSMQLGMWFWKGWWSIVACALVDPKHLAADVCCLMGVDVLFKYKMKLLLDLRKEKVLLALKKAFY